MKKQQGGFTLVEIAIVLVIIGLLLGGVLKGQELITQAKIKNVANDLNGMAAAIYGYQDRYKAFPGDDDKASSRWTGASNGDHNGKLSGAFNSKTDTDETRMFWNHLRLAGFIGGDTASLAQPQNAAGGIIGVQTDAGPSSSVELAGLIVCSSNLPGKIANAIDAQFDDGVPNKGTVRGYSQSSSVAADGLTSPTATASATAYTDDGVKLFTICKSL
ncbi:prepilin-type N-terminal cleavage/methylation domain-containing protein [Dechloromonas hortensis]|uniref:prepilin-type N-terminal cleavage/methylation domain-containing protein n=1 Tax=Dechloromonas hortensis TaxID=337779 RepID=UPI0012927C1B|nr:prepilin-type N-terminal cleavage/methylation domain-containing protein [Dechloromonas hortensis]